MARRRKVRKKNFWKTRDFDEKAYERASKKRSKKFVTEDKEVKVNFDETH